MCGITGIYTFDKSADEYRQQLENATQKLEQRGPDAHKTWVEGGIGLGHRRLSIIDTSDRGLQPMLDASEQYVIIYNGEVYNFREIRKELEGKGYLFRSDTDTEVVLNAFIAWGPKCLQRLNGFFALAIFSRKDKSLFLARDRFGIKPLVYTQQDGYFAFASELKSLVEYGWKREIDPLSFNLFFQLTYIPAPHSIFMNVHKLEAGSYLLINGNGIRKERYYEVPYRPQPDIKEFTEATRQVKATLTESVIDRLVADVPLGSFLSGGIDSSIITAIAAREVDHFKTFSIGFTENKFFDESEYARTLAKKYQTDHHHFPLSNDDLFEHLEDITIYLDEPFADSSAIPVHILSKLTRNEVTVALSGDGADEIFSGYNKHAAWQLSNRKDLTNTGIKVLSPVFRNLPKSRGNAMANLLRQLDKYGSTLNLSAHDKYWFLASFGSESMRNAIMQKSWFMDLSNYVKESVDSFETTDLNRLLGQDVKLVLQGDMLPKVDYMSMANSLEVRVPFLDPRVVDCAFNIPDHFKIKGNKRKYVLREAFKDDLPEELYRRRKHGFEVPLMEWFNGPMKKELNEHAFDREWIEGQDIFHWSGIQKVKSQLFSRNAGDAVIHAWQLYIFQKWYSNYMT